MKMVTNRVSRGILWTRSEPEDDVRRRVFGNPCLLNLNLHLFSAMRTFGLNITLSLEHRRHQRVIATHNLHPTSISQSHGISVSAVTFSYGGVSRFDALKQLH